MRTVDEQSVLGDYMRARMASADGDLSDAVQAYGSVLAARPDDTVVAGRAYRQAIYAGDMPLALRAAATMEKAGTLTADARLLLMAKAVKDRNWATATAAVDHLDAEERFDFLVPILRAWITFGSGKGDAVALLDGPFRSALTNGYSSEHRALLLLAAGRADDGLDAARMVVGSDVGRGQDFRLAAAARLVALNRKDAAVSMLSGIAPAIVAARSRVEGGQPLPGQVDTPARGIAYLFGRLAVDINRDKLSPISLPLGRIAAFLDPDSNQALFVTAQMLAAADQNVDAMALLDRVAPESPYGSVAADARLALLTEKGDGEAALAAALAARDKEGAGLADMIRVGDLYSRLERYAEAAKAYDRAIDFANANPGATDAEWSLWLLKGGALDEAGDWKGARSALERAAKLGPDQPLALNYLGYAKLERREDMEEATALIGRANMLKPGDAAITDSLGWAYYLGGHVEKAIEMLERAVASEPGDPTINEHLGDAYWTAGRRYEARYAWRAASVYAEDDIAKRLATKLSDGLTPALAAP